MKTPDWKALSTEHLVEELRKCSAEHGRFTAEALPRDANRMYEMLVVIRRELRARGIEDQRQLLKLLDDPVPATRCWVASSVLGFAPNEGERVLAELVNTQRNLVGFEASMVLEQWRAGTFNPP